MKPRPNQPSGGVFCHRCQRVVVPLRAAGHLTCPHCRFEWPCCSGENDA